MAGLVPAIHVFTHFDAINSRMPGTSAGNDEAMSG